MKKEVLRRKAFNAFMNGNPAVSVLTHVFPDGNGGWSEDVVGIKYRNHLYGENSPVMRSLRGLLGWRLLYSSWSGDLLDEEVPGYAARFRRIRCAEN